MKTWTGRVAICGNNVFDKPYVKVLFDEWIFIKFIFSNQDGATLDKASNPLDRITMCLRSVFSIHRTWVATPYIQQVGRFPSID